jgi:hypothetical protein
MKEYNVITANSIDDLVKLINEAQAQRWEPAGGPTSWITSAHLDAPYLEMRTFQFAQIMMREKRNGPTVR